VHFICNDDDRAAPAGVSEAAVAEDATWLRALLAAELDTALGPEGLRMPGAIAGALGQLVADGTLVRAPGGPDSPLLRLAQRSDGARCEAGPFEGMAGGMREEDGNANRSGLLVVKLQRASGMARLRACQHPNAVHAAVPGMGAGIWQGLFALSCLGQACPTGPLTCIHDNYTRAQTLRNPGRPARDAGRWRSARRCSRRCWRRTARRCRWPWPRCSRRPAARCPPRSCCAASRSALYPYPIHISLPYALPRRTAYLLSSGRLRTWCEAAWVRRMELAMCCAGQPAHAAFGCLSWQRPASNGGATQ